MDRLSKLKRQLKDVTTEKPVYPFTGIVKSIQGDTCTVNVGGVELTDVRLKSTADNLETFLLVPAVGSTVSMISTDGTIDNLSIFKVDKLDKIIAENAQFRTEIDLVTGKVGIKNQSTSLFEVFNDLQKLLKNLKVFTPNGPSGTPLPDTIAAIVQFETKFKQILIDN
ncbi:MAG: hypothetical protein WCY77_10290 [Weeksellaceae bacterium]